MEDQWLIEYEPTSSVNCDFKTEDGYCMKDEDNIFPCKKENCPLRVKGE